MSVWTHVAGCIRIDELPPDNTDFNMLIQEKLAAKFSRPPEGSEGPIHYHVVPTGEDGSIAWGLVYLYGDLRDFDDSEVPAILNWLNGACKGLWIRSCCVKIDVEYGRSYLIRNLKDDELLLEEVGGVV